MVKKQKFYFRSSDKETKIHGICWIPEGKPVKGVLQIAHGMVEYIDRYDAFARYLCERGFVVVGNDHLGHGDSVKSPDDWGYFGDTKGFEHVLGDIHKIRRQFRKKYPDVPYFLMGHSMGSFLTREYIARWGGGLAAAVVCGTMGANPLLGFARALAGLQAAVKGPKSPGKLIESLSTGGYHKQFPGEGPSAWLAADRSVQEAFDADPDCGFTFTAATYRDMFGGLAAVTGPSWAARVPKSLPVFVIAGDRDPVGANGKGPTQVYQWLKDAGLDVRLKLYPGMRHEILNEAGRAEVYEDVLQFLRAHLPAAE